MHREFVVVGSRGIGMKWKTSEGKASLLWLNRRVVVYA